MMALFSIILVCLFAPVFSEELASLQKEQYESTCLQSLEKHRTDMKLFFTESMVERLERVEEMLQTVVHRQALFHYCTPSPCGDHGKCILTEDEQGSVCECDEFWRGNFCDEFMICHRDLSEMRSEPLMLGREEPRCDEAGLYLGMQYSGSMAYCVTSTGEYIGYDVPRWEAGDMTCDCARDKNENRGKLEDNLYNCTLDGSYP